MELTVQSIGGSASSNVDVSEAVFDNAFKEALIHQAVTAYFAGARAGTKAQKTRSQVRGGGTKPWRQKGTGRARAGTIRSPIWRGGGNAFAAQPKNHAQKLNKKMYRGAISSILSELVRQGRLIVVYEFTVEQPKTKELVEKLKAIGADDVLIVSHEIDDKLYLAARNLYKVGVCDATAIDPVSLIGFDKVVMTVEAVKQLEEMLS